MRISDLSSDVCASDLAGLSWITVLKKRPHYRKVLFNFDPEKLAGISDDYIQTLMQDPGIIRNRLKLNAARQNARAWLAQPDPVDLIWSFVDGQPKINHYQAMRSEEHTSELQSLMRISYAVFCLKKKKQQH